MKHRADHFRFVHALVLGIISCLVWPHLSFAKAGDAPSDSQRLLSTVASPSGAYAGRSGVNPYESLKSFPKDAIFIVDTGGDLDKYVFKEDVVDGKLRIAIPVSRFFGEVDADGKLQNIQTMIDRGIIGKEARLLINVYDVDNDYQGTEVRPEQDFVFFNGKQLKDPLTSGNDTWSTRSYTIPTSEIKFPKKSSGSDKIVPADNNIEILVDRANAETNIWATEVDWIALEIDGIRPIVLIHGHGGDPSTWTTFTSFLRSDNAPFYLPLSGETESYGCISANAGHVSEIVQKVKDVYGVEKVNLVTHSRGGVDSRRYIRNGNAANVNSLIQLSAPNHGAGIGALGNSCSADDLQRGHFRDNFNYQPIRIPVSGAFNDEYRYLPLYNIEENAVPTLVTIGDDDYVVDTNSATFPWTPTCQGKIDVIESKCPDIIVKSRSIGGETTWPKATNVNRLAAGLDHGGIHDDKSTYDWVISQIGRLTAQVASTTKSLSSTEVSQAATQDENTSLISSDAYLIRSGETKSHTVKVGNTARLYFEVTYPLSTQLQSTLLDNEGKIYLPRAEQESGFGVTRRYVVENPVAGEWKLTIQSVSSRSYSLNVWQISDSIEFASRPEKSSYRPGDTAKFFAYFKDGANSIKNASVIVTILTADEIESSLALYDDGTHSDEISNDGVFTNIFVPAATGGFSYATKANGDGVQRQVNGEFTVVSNDSAFTDHYVVSTVDVNSDGLFDILQADVEVEFGASGDYEIVGSLKDVNGKVIETVLASVQSPAIGKQSIRLNFDGRLIHNNGVDGALRLADLMLRFKIDNQFSLIDYRDVAYQTVIYSSDIFQQSLVVLTGNTSDQGLDADSDLLYDFLRVTLEVKTVMPGSYQLIARLVASGGEEVEWINKTVTLVKGVNLISLDFSGEKIRQLRIDGSYAVKDLLIIGKDTAVSTSLNVTDVYTTDTYRYALFQSIPTDVEVDSANIASLPELPSAGVNVQLVAIIENNGATTDKSILVRFYEGDPSLGVRIGGDHLISGLAEGVGETVSQPWIPVTAGDKDIFVTVNPSRSIVEFDYSNNVGFKTIKVENGIIAAAAAIPAVSRFATFALIGILLAMGIYENRRRLK
jgi:pimeloyl-ACP methyl ester carboxylesterase